MTTKQSQLLLIYLGYLNDKADGIWGVKSKNACKDFQRDNDLGVDGICGPLTSAALKDCVKNDKLKGTNKKEPHKGTESLTDNNELTWDSIKYFKPSDFACKCGGKYCNGCVDKIDLEMVHKLDLVWDALGPVTINSGVRCTQHNKNVGGVSNSQHLYGKAADFVVKGVPASTVYNWCDKNIMTGNGGLGKYSTFTHLDTRNSRARW